MDNLQIVATTSTPRVDFCSDGNLEITGKSIPDAGDDFWAPISNWFSEYLKSPANQTIFRLQIDYLNTSSSKEILHMLYRLNELNERGFDAIVHWSFYEMDFDMREVGKDYEHMVKVPFVFHEITLEPVH
jgi:hypothetical protein